MLLVRDTMYCKAGKVRAMVERFTTVQWRSALTSVITRILKSPSSRQASASRCATVLSHSFNGPVGVEPFR